MRQSHSRRLSSQPCCARSAPALPVLHFQVHVLQRPIQPASSLTKMSSLWQRPPEEFKKNAGVLNLFSYRAGPALSASGTSSFVNPGTGTAPFLARWFKVFVPSHSLPPVVRAAPCAGSYRLNTLHCQKVRR
jgi:hypothetical protein